MRAWAFMLGGLIVWAIHFFALYIIASVFLTSDTARVLALLVTAGCIAANALLLRFAVPRLRREGETVNRWIVLIATLSAAISLLAVLWQGVPALLI